MIRNNLRKNIAHLRPLVVDLATGPNQHCFTDFAHERLVDGRKFRILTMEDQITRERLAQQGNPLLQGSDAAETQDRVSPNHFKGPES